MNKIAELKDISNEINVAHNKVVEACRSSVGHAIKAGELLIKAKSVVIHGEWGNWLKDNLILSKRTAQAYMRLAREYPKLEASNTQHVADLPLRDAIQVISSTTAVLNWAKKTGIDIEMFTTNEKSGDSVRRKAIQEIRKTKYNAHIKSESTAPVDIDGQAMTLEKNDDLGLFRLRKEGNEAYIKLQERIDFYKEDESYMEDKLEAKELIREAEKLETQAKRLKKEAEEIMLYAQDNIRVRLLDIYGKPVPAEALTIKPNNNDQYWTIKEKDQEQAISSLLELLKDGCAEITGRDINMDLTLMSYVDIGCTYPANNWTGIGLEAF